MAETYTITVRNSGPWVGCENEETYSLEEMGYTDAEQEFWNAGYEYSGEVNRG